MSDKLYEQLLDELNIRVYDLPEGVTVSSREEYMFVQNFNGHSVTLELPGSYRNVQTDERVGGLIHMEPFSIFVICAE
jgi:beta-galactosidase